MGYFLALLYGCLLGRLSLIASDYLLQTDTDFCTVNGKPQTRVSVVELFSSISASSFYSKVGTTGLRLDLLPLVVPLLFGFLGLFMYTYFGVGYTLILAVIAIFAVNAITDLSIGQVYLIPNVALGGIAIVYFLSTAKLPLSTDNIISLVILTVFIGLCFFGLLGFGDLGAVFLLCLTLDVVGFLVAIEIASGVAIAVYVLRRNYRNARKSKARAEIAFVPYLFVGYCLSVGYAVFTIGAY